MRIDREPGEGIVLYLGEKRGSRYVSVGLGFSGYELRRGCWRFMHPYVAFGRLFSDQRTRRFSFRLKVPAHISDFFAP